MTGNRQWLRTGMMLSVFLTLTLMACRKPSIPPEAPAAEEHDPLELAEESRKRELPEAFRVSMGIKVDAPSMGVSGSASGALLVSPPDRIRLEIYAPLVGPRFYAVSDGVSVTSFSVGRRTWSTAPDAEALLRESTQGAFGLEDLIDILLGRMPMEESVVDLTKGNRKEPRFEAEGPNGMTLAVLLDPRWATPLEIECTSAEGELILKAVYADYRRKGKILLPESIVLEVPSLEFKMELLYRNWEELPLNDSVYTLQQPAGSESVDLQDLLFGAP